MHEISKLFPKENHRDKHNQIHKKVLFVIGSKLTDIGFIFFYTRTSHARGVT